MSHGIDIAEILVSAASGAVAGSIVSFVTGPTIAEREERGRRRVAARQAIGHSIQVFRYNLANARLVLLEGQSPKEDEILISAFELAKSVYESLPVMPKIERSRLKRSVSNLLGKEMLEVARLRPDAKIEIADVASASAIMLYRADPGSTLRGLLKADPTSPNWEKAIRSGERLSRRYY